MFDVQVRPQYQMLQVRAKDTICEALRHAGRAKPPKPDGAADVTLFVAVHKNTTKIYQSPGCRFTTQTGLPRRCGESGSLNETTAAANLYMAGYDGYGVR